MRLGCIIIVVFGLLCMSVVMFLSVYPACVLTCHECFMIPGMCYHVVCRYVLLHNICSGMFYYVVRDVLLFVLSRNVSLLVCVRNVLSFV